MTPTPGSHSPFQNFRFRRRPNTIQFQRDITPVPSTPTALAESRDHDDGGNSDEAGEEEDEDSGIEEERAGQEEVEEEEDEEEEDEEDVGIDEVPPFSPTQELDAGRLASMATAMPDGRLLRQTPLPPAGSRWPVGVSGDVWNQRTQQGANIAHRVPVPMELDPPFDPSALGLKEIGNLASWTVSSCKPGCGVDALRDDDTAMFWQSDGPQPHHLNIHFSRLVSIRAIRIFLDFDADESYTPTRITLFAGTGYHDLIPFSALSFEQPKGWIDVPLDHIGGGSDGKTLRCFLVQVRIMENHQNGKDTHVRGLKIFARDDRVRGVLGGLDRMASEETRNRVDDTALEKLNGGERAWLVEPDWMGEPELR